MSYLRKVHIQHCFWSPLSRRHKQSTFLASTSMSCPFTFHSNVHQLAEKWLSCLPPLLCQIWSLTYVKPFRLFLRKSLKINSSFPYRSNLANPCPKTTSTKWNALHYSKLKLDPVNSALLVFLIMVMYDSAIPNLLQFWQAPQPGFSYFKSLSNILYKTTGVDLTNTFYSFNNLIYCY